MFHNPKRKPDNRSDYIKRIIHSCAYCGTDGLIPGILETSRVDEAICDWAKDHYDNLYIDENGMCERCRKSPEIERITQNTNTAEQDAAANP